ncbi:SAM-dependent methyltransferase [Actinomadura fulvescens]|uniref:S-adenosyl methyltransferase n=1 Tax=Actinomadura fulvescens TaxID=46160 RepID=A0ABN3QYX1_9ACTN
MVPKRGNCAVVQDKGVASIRRKAAGPGVNSIETDHAGSPVANRAHAARIWNQWLGGKDTFGVDRLAAKECAALAPGIVDAVRHERKFKARTVRHLAEAGIRQFLDIGVGLPLSESSHEIAQRIDSQSHVAYIDDDPAVMAYARALLTSREGRAPTHIQADLSDPQAVALQAIKVMDDREPVGILLVGTLNFVTDHDDAAALVRCLLDAAPAGSFLALAHLSDQVSGEQMQQAIEHWNKVAHPAITTRSHQQVAHLLDGLNLLAPGITTCTQWRPEQTCTPPVDQLGAVGRVPPKRVTTTEAQASQTAASRSPSRHIVPQGRHRLTWRTSTMSSPGGASSIASSSP